MKLFVFIPHVPSGRYHLCDDCQRSTQATDVIFSSDSLHSTSKSNINQLVADDTRNVCLSAQCTDSRLVEWYSELQRDVYPALADTYSVNGSTTQRLPSQQQPHYQGQCTRSTISPSSCLREGLQKRKQNPPTRCPY